MTEKASSTFQARGLDVSSIRSRAPRRNGLAPFQRRLDSANMVETRNSRIKRFYRDIKRPEFGPCDGNDNYFFNKMVWLDTHPHFPSSRIPLAVQPRADA